MAPKIKHLSQSGLVPATVLIIATGILGFQPALQARPDKGEAVNRQARVGERGDKPDHLRDRKKDHRGNHEDRQARMEERFQEMSEQLGLTEDQKSALQADRESVREEMRAIKEDDSLSRDEKRDKMKAFRESRKEKLQSVLTDEQKATLEEMKAKRGQKAKLEARQPKK